MRQKWSLYSAIAAILLASGCAAINPTVQFSAVGESNVALERKLRNELTAAARDNSPIEDLSKIKIYIDNLPPGVEVRDGVLSVAPGSGNVLIGKISLYPDGSTFFPDYESGWKKPFCYTQTGLVFATVFAWGMVPTYYPCYTTASRDVDDWLDKVRRVTYRAGATMAVGSFIWKSADGESAAGFTGILIRSETPAPAAATGI